MGTLAPLPAYPSTQARKGLSASQLAQFHSNLSNALARTIALPPAKLDTPQTRAFISSYAGDAAQQLLETLWEDIQPVKHDDRLRQRVLLLAEKLASSAPGLESKTLLDLCVAFPTKITHLRSILTAALDGIPNLTSTFASEVVPAFTSLLSSSRSSGLYGLRKIACCLTNLLRPSPPDLIRLFAHSKDFLVALAHAYGDGLATISHSYGGIRIGMANRRQLDSWEKIWLDVKVDIIDALHIIVTTMVRDISTASVTELAVKADRTFEIVFALLDITPQFATVGPPDSVPFLNRSLIADYQYAYDLSKTLSSALHRASRDDARVERLESSLRSLAVEQPDGGAKDPGALKLLLDSSDIAPRTSTTTVPSTQPVTTNKGKAKATTPEPSLPHDADLDMQVVQVLEIFPDHSPEYIRKLLTHPSFPFCGNAERVIEALLEGTAPGDDALGAGVAESIPISVPMERRNVFDDEVMDLSRVHIGKKSLGVSLSQDRAEKERIIRLAEAISVDSDEESGQPKVLNVMDLDDEVDEAGTSTVKILVDGEDSGDEEVDPIKPETILELAYIRDPKLFDRDGETRRSKKRAELKQQTGWTDEQIEGWRIMLERNPKKERVLQKHEFSGNRIVNVSIVEGTGDHPGSGQRGGGRGKGRGRGRGRGGGDGGGGGRSEPGPGEKNEHVARERALKEKHKSNNRRRGHDKKMRKAGVGPE